MGVGASNPLLTISLRSVESNPTSLKLRTGRGTSRPGVEGSGLKTKIRVKGSGLSKFAIKIMYYLQLPLLSPIDSPILPLLTC